MNRVFRSGSELAVCIPAEIAKQLRIVEGSEVDVQLLDEEHFLLTIVNTLPDGIDPEFAKHVDEFIEKYRETLENLANR